MEEQTLNEDVSMDSSPLTEDLGMDADPSAETQNTETAEETQEQQESEVEQEVTEEEVKEEPKEEMRFDQHPRFKELISEKNTLKQEMEALKQQLAQMGQKDTPSFTQQKADLRKQLEEGEIDLSDYEAKRDEINQAELDAKFDSERTKLSEEKKLSEAQDQFLKDNPYVSEVLNTAYDKVDSLKRANPLHDDVSAAMAVKIAELQEAAKDFEATQEKAIAEAVEKAKKETEAQVIKNFQAKQQARSLGSGSRPAPDDADVLKDTAKHGGVQNALAARLKAMRSK